MSIELVVMDGPPCYRDDGHGISIAVEVSHYLTRSRLQKYSAVPILVFPTPPHPCAAIARYDHIQSAFD